MPSCGRAFEVKACSERARSAVGDVQGQRVRMLRADMDALPIMEQNDIPYRSVHEGVMHACGHDTHVSMLMTVAEVLAGIKSEIKGSVKFIFQPAEEGAPEGEEGGASLMIKEGVMENPKVDAIFGLHIQSRIESGKIQYKPGAFMAASDFFSIKIKGKASHGSQPWLGIDPIAVSASVIQVLQNIVSRESELTKAPVVITTSGALWPRRSEASAVIISGMGIAAAKSSP